MARLRRQSRSLRAALLAKRPQTAAQPLSTPMPPQALSMPQAPTVQTAMAAAMQTQPMAQNFTAMPAPQRDYTGYTPTQIAHMAGGLLPNAQNFTVGDALKAALRNQAPQAVPDVNPNIGSQGGMLPPDWNKGY